MLSPNELEYVPDKITKLYRGLQLDILHDITERIAVNHDISRAADWEINRLYELGVAKEVIRRHIRRTLGLTAEEIERIYAEVLAEDYARYEPIYKRLGKSFIPFRENRQLQQLIGGVKEQTLREYSNITQSLGFALKNADGTRTFLPLSKAYQTILDKAAFGMLSGAYDYNTMLRQSVKELTDSGLRAVDYFTERAGGQITKHTNRIEVAARRALMTGFNQVVAKITEDNADQLGADHFEVTYHRGARPTHQPWQGRVYTLEQLVTVCGYGDVTGLKGANCYHDFHPFFPGISKRLYTDGELDRMNAEENTPKQYGDKKYTVYDALQRQRRIEASLRRKREEIALLEKGGASEDDILAAKAKYHALSHEYSQFSKAMKLPQQRERIRIDGFKGVDVSFGKSAEKAEKTVAKSGGSGIMINKTEETAANGLHYVGTIDKQLYSCVTKDISTDELIITEKQIEHIFKNHPGDFLNTEDVISSIQEAVSSPDYIVESDKPNTAFILKELSNQKGKSRLIMRLKTSEDPVDYKNSIITFQKTREREWRRIIRNKKILYKKE